MRHYLLSGTALLLFFHLATAQETESMFTGTTGVVAFTSDAPLEVIHAHSEQLAGALNPVTNGLAFSVRMSSFQGFNSAVQREHFMENYMEVTQYPVATFSGKLIEVIDFTRDGTYDVRVKGRLNIHGVETERIIQGKLLVQGRQVSVNAAFRVLLVEHNIHVPKLLTQKIAEAIDVSVGMTLEKGE